MKHRIAILVFGLLCATPAISGPFGLEIGMQLNQLAEYNLKDAGDHFYTTTRLPKSHSSFMVYGLVIHPDTGLCQIRAASKKIETSAYGIELRAKFEQIAGQLSKSYGEANIKDFLRHGSIWDDAKDFMMGMRQGERILQASWGNKKGPEIKDGIFEILLIADADSSDEGSLILQYRFANSERCDQLMNEEEADAF